MTSITLSKAETSLLLDAAGRSGALLFSDSTKPSTRERTVGRLLRDELVVADEVGHALTPAGYRAVGLRPPRAKPSETAMSAEPRGTKNALVLELLGRGEGASLAELIEATGWLPHTARAALSRIRSAGKPLSKTKRDDDVTAYRIVPDEPAPVRRARKPKPEAVVAAVA